MMELPNAPEHHWHEGSRASSPPRLRALVSINGVSALAAAVLALFLWFASPANAQQPGAVPEPGEIVRDCPDCGELVVVPTGEFEMGGNDTPYEKPIHKVTIAKPF